MATDSNVTVQQRVVIAADTVVSGHVVIKSGTVVHPHATLDASRGPMVVGENCIVEEHVRLVSPPQGLSLIHI